MEEDRKISTILVFWYSNLVPSEHKQTLKARLHVSSPFPSPSTSKFIIVPMEKKSTVWRIDWVQNPFSPSNISVSIHTMYTWWWQRRRWWQVPCEFWADQPEFSFSGEELRQGSFQPCPAQDGASSMAGSSLHDLVGAYLPLKMTSPYHHTLRSSTGASKCVLYLKNPLYGTLAKRGTPLSKTNSMITYFDSHTTNTSDIMFKWYGINRVMSNLFKLGIHIDSSAVFIDRQRFLLPLTCQM